MPQCHGHALGIFSVTYINMVVSFFASFSLECFHIRFSISLLPGAETGPIIVLHTYVCTYLPLGVVRYTSSRRGKP